MVKPAGAKIWNEELVEALKAREDLARRQGKQNALTWNAGWKEICKVRGDIYCFKNGRIANYPTKLSKTVDNLCRGIITGTHPKFPPGFNVAEGPVQGNPYLNYPYLNRIKKRGGAYAILLAFHSSKSSILTRQQICDIGQRFCDEEMETNYHAGRSHAGWSSIKTLQKHDLISVQGTLAYNERAGGVRAMGVSKYCLTDNGKLFIDALLQKNPAIAEQEGISRPDHIIHNDAAPQGTLSQRVKLSPPTKAIAGTTSAAHRKAQDAQELREWVETAMIGYQKQFHVGKDRRSNLHDVCTLLNSQLTDRRLRHESSGVGRSRVLTVTVTSSINPVAKTPPRRQRSFDAKETPPKRLAVPAGVAAAQAAMERQAIHESRLSCTPPKQKAPPQVTPIDLLDSSDEEEDRKPSARRVIVLDSDSDDDIPGSVLFAMKKPADLTSVASSENIRPLTIAIDDRERNRNHTPRVLRMELTRLVTTGTISRIWGSPEPTVEERSLPSGDFSFHSQGKAFPVLIERKRIGDLVQRSFKKDHWYQLKRMQDRGISFFMLEGDSRTASQYTAFGSQDIEDYSPLQHTIDDEASLFRFFGRAILSDHEHSVRFCQTRDEQASLRMVGAIGLMLCSSPTMQTVNQRPPDTKADRVRLRDRLVSRGLPFQLAVTIADEIGSAARLDALYSKSDTVCRDLLLSPILRHVQLDHGGSGDSWSRAVHQLWFSSLSDPSSAKDSFEQCAHLVQQHAVLLEKLHAGRPCEEALDETLSMSKCQASFRKVIIEVPPTYRSLLPSDSPSAFFKVVESRTFGKVPFIQMRVKSGPFCSSKLTVNLFDGTNFLARVQSAVMTYKKTNRASVIARHVAGCIANDMRGGHRQILLVRALKNAQDQAAKANGFSFETNVIVELVQAELMLHHQVTILHAQRNDNDREAIIRQLALACFEFDFCIHSETCP